MTRKVWKRLHIACSNFFIMLRNPSIRKNKDLRVLVSSIELRYLIGCAKQAGVTRSEYVRRVVLEGKIKKDPTLAPEVLAFKGHLLHLCGLLEPFSRKRLDGDDLNALDRAEVKQIIHDVGEMTRQLKNHLQ